MRLPVIVPALLAAGALSAAETAINDLRGGFGFWPDNYEADGQDAGIDDAWRLGVQYMRSLRELEDIGGFIYGAEASLTLASGDDIDSSAVIADAHAGWAWSPEPLPALHLEGTGFLGLGMEMVEAGDEDDLAPVIEYGLRAAALYTLDNRWQIGLDLRWLLGSQSEQDLGGGDFDWENDGLGALFLVGYRM